MRAPLRSGISFGLTSGVITTLGLMVGLQSGTQSRLAVVGGVLTIAIADALSDALLEQGAITVSVEDRDANRAATLANAYVEELHRLTQSFAVTEAARRRGEAFELDLDFGQDPKGVELDAHSSSPSRSSANIWQAA